MIIDTHCHYNLEPLYSGKKSHFKIDDNDPLLNQNWQDHWKKAQKNGVKKSIVVGTNLITSKRALKIASTDKNLFASVGIHPSESSNIKNLESEIKKLKKLTSNKQVVAIGEIGLDYFHLEDNNSKKDAIKKQKILFKSQLKIALKLNLPVILHVRDKKEPVQPTKNNAYWDALEIIKSDYIRKIEYNSKTRKEETETQANPFVLHCVSGSLTYVLEALSLGGFVGFDGNLTYKNTDNLKKILRYIPFNRILVETDAPYLPTQKHRGKICEPWMIKETVEFIKKEFGIDEETLIENTKILFKIL